MHKKITKELLKNKKIKEVKIINNIAHISYSGKLSKNEIIKSITDIDYIIKEEYISDKLQSLDTKIKLKEFIIILAVIILIILSLYDIFGFNIFNVIPVIDSNVSYIMLIVTGLLTSIHCVSMCGSINIYVSSSKQISGDVKGLILYNIGRVMSYTMIGGICGLIGSVISFNNTINGIIILIASIFMIILSLNMLGFTKINLPKLIKINLNLKKKSSFLIGVANGLMPCGPLQAMQLYALSTGSFVLGALSMFLFGVGTVPLMLGVGIILNFLKEEKDYQIIKFDLKYTNYEDIILQKNIPVKIIINVDKKYLTNCNQELYSLALDFRQKLVEGENVIEFIPTEEGDTYLHVGWE